ncbi:carbon-monoxide dehydrogenase medium subunit [Sulfobacillus thermosulfidooxidans DSM 9293]|uniref:Carbon-monoxide dehydrogenase medium subunit n=1 Tax=Sulfobacillus thermosulfidooxidans (strain DSM 9293 / VKM B-1269 / AT-1) TaxID=929705 RepID=A0A1W1WGZ1_SULTA|nr:xanthine dehydrogenase family protein subunit M [Sulfobacillus thermosulfidooxidans]SMC05003.1 carbon-monoxide dehydrogenase medium subunit [Sulfobacillus thermosulfidooxidans DSM 9293]
MYTASFEYRRAHSVDEALHWLQADPENSKILAGGHSLLPLMKLMLAQPQVLIDIGRISSLQGIWMEDHGLRIGAYTTYAEIVHNQEITRFCPLLAQVAATIGDVQVRNRGTIGGSLCHADPQADMPAAALALDAELVMESPRGQRVESANEFFQAPFMTSLAADEMLTAIRIPKMPIPVLSTYLKRPHPASGYPVIGVALWLKMDGVVVRQCHLAITGIAMLPFRAFKVEEYVQGQKLDAQTIARASALAQEDAVLEEDEDGYKSYLLQVYVERAFWQLLQSSLNE